MVDASARDMTGRPAVRISRTDSVSKIIYAAFENPHTGGVPELADSYPPGTGTGPAPHPSAAYAGYDLVLSISRASAIPPDPYRG